jgi:hypothetical protein
MTADVFGRGVDRHVNPVLDERNKYGVPQVLSISTLAPWRWATAAIAGMSWISKVSEPGDSQ